MPDGPIAVSLASLPPPDSAHVVIANELLDNLPVRLLERTAGGWEEVGVGDADGLVEVLIPLTDVEPRVDASPGARIAWQAEAAGWVRDALDVAPRVAVFDYMTTTAEMAARPWRDWLRTYRGHERGVSPLDAVGTQDITCEVALDQLTAVRMPTLVSDQRTFLVRHGIDGLVEEGRAAWEAGATRGDLEALRGRSRVREADALMDVGGLGAFTVAEWVR